MDTSERSRGKRTTERIEVEDRVEARESSGGANFVGCFDRMFDTVKEALKDREEAREEFLGEGRASKPMDEGYSTDEELTADFFEEVGTMNDKRGKIGIGEYVKAAVETRLNWIDVEAVTARESLREIMEQIKELKEKLYALDVERLELVHFLAETNRLGSGKTFNDG